MSERKEDPLAILNFAKAPIFLLAVTCLFLFSASKLVYSVTAPFDVPRETGPQEFGGLEYSSCDKLKSLKFSKDGFCIRADSSGTIKAKYLILSDQFNFMDLFRGYLRRKEFFYRSEGDELVDQNNIVLYQPQAREKVIVDKMWFYARCAQDQFNEKKSYPSSLEKSKRTYQNFSYTNPFTGKTDCAEILVLGSQSNQIDLGVRGSSDRRWRPGAILCVHTDTKHYCIQGFDRQGKPLASSDPSRYYLIKLEYGKYLNAEWADLQKQRREHPAEESSPQDVSAEQLNPTQDSIVLIDKDGGVENLVHALRRLPQIVLWFSLLTSIICLSFSKKFKRPQQCKLISKRAIVFCVISLTAFYGFAFF